MDDELFSDEDGLMFGKLVGSVGGKMTKAAMPGVADAVGDYAIELLRKHFTTAKIDPLTKAQEDRIKELIHELIVVKAAEKKAEKDKKEAKK